MASNPRVLLTCWLAQAAAWLVAQMGPVVVRLVLDARAATRAARLKAERAKYEEDWGVPPLPPSTPPQPPSKP